MTLIKYKGKEGGFVEKPGRHLDHHQVSKACTTSGTGGPHVPPGN